MKEKFSFITSWFKKMHTYMPWYFKWHSETIYKNNGYLGWAWY